MQTNVNPTLNTEDRLDRAGSCLGACLPALIFLVVGAGLTWWGWNILGNAKASTSWPKATGRIISSSVEYSRDSDGHDSYKPEVTYTYAVNNRFYKSHAIKFGENSYDNKPVANEIANRYAVGKKVVVYYDPQNPENSILEPGVTGGSYIVLGIGVLFVMIGLIVPPLAFFFRSNHS